MTGVDPDEHARRLAAESLAVGDPTRWFEALYSAAEEGAATVPWDRGGPHHLLVQWATTQAPDGRGRRALVVGAGLGEDAEYVAGLGFATVAFDVSEAAVRTARRRHPDSAVDYLVADLRQPPSGWLEAFDLVVESLTVQSLPDPPRREAIGQVGRMVAPGGTLLVIAAARDEDGAPPDGPPWPLTRAEIQAFATEELRPVRVEDLTDLQDPTVRRWRVEFHRPTPDRPPNR